jgi:hypothetical protein
MMGEVYTCAFVTLFIQLVFERELELGHFHFLILQSYPGAGKRLMALMLLLL